MDNSPNLSYHHPTNTMNQLAPPLDAPFCAVNRPTAAFGSIDRNMSISHRKRDKNYRIRTRRAQHDAKVVFKRSARPSHILSSQPHPGPESTRQRLPATPAAFQLGSRRWQSLRRLSFHSSLSRSRTSTPDNVARASLSTSVQPTVCREKTLKSVLQVSQLRAEAFSQLQRSVAEGGEELVRRMQEWEADKCSPSTQPRDSNIGTCGEAHPGRQTFDSGMMNEDSNISSFGGNHRPPLLGHSSELRSRSLQFSGAVDSPNTEDDVEFELNIDAQSVPSLCSVDTSTLSHVQGAESASSSFANPLPQRSPSFSSTFWSPPEPVPSAACEEKAIAALTLALANGAGSLNDYNNVVSVSVDEDIYLKPESVGAMWD